LKILIIRFSSIGDIVLTTPVFRALKQQLQAEVHFLTKKKYAPILSANPNIDRTLILDDNFYEMVRQIKKEQFDVIIDLHNNLRTKLLQIALRRKFRSFFKANIEKWLIVNMKMDRLPKEHIVDRYLKTVKYLGVNNDQKGLDFYYKNEPGLLSKWKIEGPYIVFAIGAAHLTKQIPETLLCRIIEQIDTKIILIGGQDVAELGKKLGEQYTHTFNLCGELNLEQSAQIVDNSVCLISGDTGMMHIGAALKKQMISIWGSTIPAFGMYPYYGKEDIKHKIIQREVSCRPCSKTGHSVCPKGHFNCMMKIKAEDIISAINEIK
jgi:ADP-heptose:LPS heptosyltransferase